MPLIDYLRTMQRLTNIKFSNFRMDSVNTGFVHKNTVDAQK